jgi:hypothetical protein
MATYYKDDLTIIFLTANEHPPGFTEFHKQHLLKAAGDFPIISVCREPVDFGTVQLDTEPKSHLNMYLQMLKAAKSATTPYIASAESDVLYPPGHYNLFRPPLDTFSYNFTRWLLFTWNPVFNMRFRKSNCTLIAPRELFIEAWEERLAKHGIENYPKHYVGEVGRPNLDTWLGVTVRKCTEFYTKIGVVQVNHPNGTEYYNWQDGQGNHGKGTKKAMGPIRANEIPYWGRGEDLAKVYR